MCLYNAPDHVQNHCLLHCHFNPTHTTSSSSSSFNQSNTSTRPIHLVPPPLADRFSSPPLWHTFRGSHHNHTTRVRIHAPTIWFCGVHPPTLGTDNNDVYGTDAWKNINSDWNISSVLQHYNEGNVMITHCFFSFLSVYLCLLFVSWPVNCSSPVNCIPFSYLSLFPWSQNYPFDFRIFFLEYSVVLLIVLLSFSTFFLLSHTSHNRSI